MSASGCDEWAKQNPCMCTCDDDNDECADRCKVIAAENEKLRCSEQCFMIAKNCWSSCASEMNRLCYVLVGISQRYPPIFDSTDLLQFNEGCSTKILATVTALGNNGVITISANDDATRAKVDVLQTSSDNSAGFSTTIQIKQKACMDRETENVWNLQLLAEDTSKMKTIETLPIYILDVNDEHPSFSSKLFQINVSESTQPSTEVLKIKATDPDNGIGGISAALYGNAFGIDASSGSITVKTKLDFSKLSLYQYLIVGTDFGELKGNATLIIKIQEKQQHQSDFLNFLKKTY
ncbi:DCHS1_2 [Mytilus edulis]|uniref:DCHS1_2 n=1 Tax=Mytilus edulis TaxID=6550 RepID=A0A8S3SL45_MYTED|nr:DCHS1_2 [Mytilus edulis]